MSLFTMVVCVVLLVVGVIVGFVIGRLSLPKTRYDGTLDISQKDSSKIHQLEITTAPEDLGEKAKIVLKVRKVSEAERSQALHGM